jgi:micrococcal nuclease
MRAIDGDTIQVVIEGEEYRVRYIGVDAPETVHPKEPVEWMGPESFAINRKLVEGKTVYLEKDVSETDQYGRLLRYVFLSDGTFVNGELVRLGFALVGTYPPDVKYQDLLLGLQQQARENDRGLWGPTPTP